MRENGGGAVGTEKPTAFRPLGRRAALGLLLLSAWGAFAAPARVPSKLQLALLTKIFAQDDSLQSRNRIRVQIVFDPAGADSAWLKTEVSELARGAAALAVGGRGVETEVVRVEEIKDKPIPDIYFLCALNDASAQAVFETARTRKIRCFGSEPGDARRGASVSIGVADGKPRIRINRGAAAAQGAKFSEAVLNLADVF